MNTKDLNMADPAFTLLKGDPKTGKSIAAHSYRVEPCALYPNGLPNTYTFSFDRRMQSVKAFYRGRDFEFDHFDSLIAVNKRIKELKDYPEGSFPFGAIIFDGMTRYSDLAIDCMIEHRIPDALNASESGRASKTLRAGIAMAEIEDYGGEARALTQALNGLLAINIKHKVHVIVIAHVIQTETTDIKTKIVKVTRQLLTAGKKIAAKLPVDFNEVYHFYVNADMETGKPSYYAVTKSNDLDWAATCMPLPLKIEWTSKDFYGEILKSLAGDAFFGG